MSDVYINQVGAVSHGIYSSVNVVVTQFLLQVLSQIHLVCIKMCWQHKTVEIPTLPVLLNSRLYL